MHTEEFQTYVGLDQGSGLSPFFLIAIPDVFTECIRTSSPNAMVFADDLVICEETGDTSDYQLERWRDVFETHGLTVSR